MPKEEWGVKRVCPTTGKRFYDLGRSPVVSPYTGEIVSLETGGKTRVAIKDEKVAAKPAPAETEALEEEDVLEDDDTEVDLGDDVLEEDDDDNVSLDDIADVGSEEDES
ncbi:MAG: TIGR02300 family protein [Pseudomonadota bacterium]